MSWFPLYLFYTFKLMIQLRCCQNTIASHLLFKGVTVNSTNSTKCISRLRELRGSLVLDRKMIQDFPLPRKSQSCLPESTTQKSCHIPRQQVTIQNLAPVLLVWYRIQTSHSASWNLLRRNVHSQVPEAELWIAHLGTWIRLKRIDNKRLICKLSSGRDLSSEK